MAVQTSLKRIRDCRNVVMGQRPCSQFLRFSSIRTEPMINSSTGPGVDDDGGLIDERIVLAMRDMNRPIGSHFYPSLTRHHLIYHVLIQSSSSF
ncbi:hypothetical protein GALMADRAFT_254850 [Galerina marginata CBS 339.88]|uniref:Uncharacterized protein n=1 Tax=Galerina marginata (strain CBS 339.88) TaxID=685588 RepID=A0A067SRS0_GALM3|nr:hypothetical protein GALMADRAFT_254850 [Galerina marginata CBS 339.88]